MILASLQQADRYCPALPGLDAALAYLRSTSLSELTDGRHEIDGDRVFALVSRYRTHDPQATHPEAHRRHVDVQFLVSGQETIYWTPLSGAGQPTGPYEPQRDITFYQAVTPSRSCELYAGDLAIFFPDDVHHPGCHAGAASDILKVVVKVRLN